MTDPDTDTKKKKTAKSTPKPNETMTPDETPQKTTDVLDSESIDSE